MPTYEFRCPAGHGFEKFWRKISDAPTSVECPTCGRTAERKVSAGAGLLFKGQGFYITDYGKDGKKDQRAAAAAKSEGSPKASEGDASKADGSSASASGSGDAPQKTETASSPAKGEKSPE
jgi:putative FmdB family regulatory protein